MCPQIGNAAAKLTPSLSSTSSNRKKKRKKSANAPSNSYLPNDGDGGTILHSKLSLKKQLSLKKSCRQTPWYDTNELIETGSALLLSLKLFPTHHHGQHQKYTTTPEGLTPDEHTQLQLALRRVAVWRGHSARGRLSHAVDISAGLAGLLLSDAERTCHSNATGNNPYQLRNSYSTLLLRSVNGLADTYRHQRKSSLLSVSHCCALAGLPLWIVDIRHDASHNDLPSLGLCRIGAIETLRFWKTRYWDSLESKVWGKKSETGNTESDDVGICTFALDCLVRYQRAAFLEAKERESSGRIKDTKAKSAKRQMKEEGESNQIDHETEDLLLLLDEPKRVASKPICGDHIAGSNNPFAILHGDKPKKKKPKKDPEEKNDPEKDVVVTNETELTSGNNEFTTRAVANKLQPSSRDCAAEFVREVPMDIAISTAIKFLVWGIGDDDLMIHQGPAILSGQAGLLMTQDVDVVFDNLRATYDPLIIAITNAYPGFVSALCVHLIDSILCLDSEIGNQDERSCADASLVFNGSELDLHQVSCNIQYLSKWVRYILSREFLMHFNRSAAMYTDEVKSVLVASQTGEKREFQSQPIDLKKKGRNNWTQNQLKFMQSPLQYTTFFRSLGIPMNSVCDRLVSHRDTYFCHNDSVVGKLLHLFEGILGENRVVSMGLVVQSETNDAGNYTCVADATEVERETARPAADKSAEAVASTDTTLTAKDMSLEDIEAFLRSATTPEDNCPGAGTNDPDNVEDHLALRSTIESSNGIKPWTLCKSWDSCAIGSMPGYPA